MLSRLFAILTAFFFTTVVILGSSIGVAQAQGPACFEIFANPTTSEPTPIRSIMDPALKIYRDFYGRAEHLAHFWRHHKHFGVVRTANNRILLVAKNQTLAKQLLDDIAAYTGLPTSQAQSTRGPGWLLYRSASYDITNMLPELLQNRLELLAERNGPNCINACLVIGGQKQSLVYTSAKEIKFWLRPPFAKKITDARELKPGDMLVIDGVSESGMRRFSHAAIYVSPRLVLTKNGFAATQPLRLMDINEMGGMSMVLTKTDLNEFGPGYQRVLSAYRLGSVEALLAARGVEMPANYRQTQAEIEAFEVRVAAMHDGFTSRDALRPELNVLRSKWHVAIRREIEALDPSQLGYDRHTLIADVWTGLNLRLDALFDSFTAASNDPHF